MHGEYRRKHNEAADTIEQYISWMFCTAAQLFAATDSAGLQVRASKGGITSTFSIDMLRTAYFFRDRDLKDEGGRRIFHIVRTHPRVRSHFRGARDFTWHGYQIHISVPGLHHWTASSFDVGAYEVEPDTRVPGMMPVSAVADMVASEQEK